MKGSGACIFSSMLASPPWERPQGSPTYVLNIQPLSPILKELKRTGPPSHREKQHRPTVTIVSFRIQNNKIAPPSPPSSPPSWVPPDLTLSWEKSQGGFLHHSQIWKIVFLQLALAPQSFSGRPSAFSQPRENETQRFVWDSRDLISSACNEYASNYSIELLW